MIFFLLEQEVEEEVEDRPRYAWEEDTLTSTGMAINKQGKMMSTEKKLTPQQKKAEKVTPQTRDHGAQTLNRRLTGSGSNLCITRHERSP